MNKYLYVFYLLIPLIAFESIFYSSGKRNPGLVSAILYKAPDFSPTGICFFLKKSFQTQLPVILLDSKFLTSEEERQQSEFDPVDCIANINVVPSTKVSKPSLHFNKGILQKIPAINDCNG